MSFHAMRYRTGEEIHPGDRILYAGSAGEVLFVCGLPGVPAEWASPEEWLCTTRGFMLAVEKMGLVFLPESDEDLDFVKRK